MFDSIPDRPKLSTAALRRWLPGFMRRTPDLLSAYLIPGRVSLNTTPEFWINLQTAHDLARSRPPKPVRRLAAVGPVLSVS